MDALMLSRIQFAFTVGYHFIFVPISIGLAMMVVLSERRYYKSGIPAHMAASKFWIKLLHDELRHRRRHGHHHGVRLRHQLGRLLALRRQHLRRAARRRGSLRLLPRVHVPRRPALRAPEGLARALLRLGVAGHDRHLALGPLDPHRQLLAADAARLQDRGRQGRPDRLLGRGVQPVDRPPVLPHHGRLPDRRLLRRRQHLGLVPAQEASPALRPSRPDVGARRRPPGLGGHAPHRPLARARGRRGAAGQDGRLRGALRHAGTRPSTSSAGCATTTAIPRSPVSPCPADSASCSASAPRTR